MTRMPELDAHRRDVGDVRRCGRVFHRPVLRARRGRLEVIPAWAGGIQKKHDKRSHRSVDGRAEVFTASRSARRERSHTPQYATFAKAPWAAL